MSRPLRSGLIWRLCLGATAVAILVIALLPPGGGEPLFPQVDKVQHAAAFLALWAIGRRAGLGPTWVLAAALLGFGVTIELAQAALTTTRDPSVADVLADAVGVAAGRWLLGSP